MSTTGVSLLLDLYDCKSPLINDAVLEQVFTTALQFAGLEPLDHMTQKFSPHGTTHIFILKQAHATVHTWAAEGFVAIDVYSCGAPETIRPGLEIIRGYLTQKLIARTAKAQLIERGT
ncbi:MAG: adenosylmethionine decarboxylase [Chloroflexi bacterium]|nr:adenosylmethionine decarboxylase [Chloroflexota bacterium]